VDGLDDKTMWQAVAVNDAAYDGRFVYAVQTTGVYCRPSCGSRTPRRENVRFFAGAEAAEKAGYRPCKRCRPDSPRPVNTQLVEEMCRYVEASFRDGPVSLDVLARRFSLSSTYLQRVFKDVMGITPREYADALRMRAFKAHLRDDQDSVTTAAYAVGLSSSSRLYARVDAHLGMTPTDYRAGGPTEISYAVTASGIGVVLAAASDRGICAVFIGDSVEDVIADLAVEFPSANLSAQPGALQGALDAILQHLDGQTPRIELPLDIRATAFQRRVWRALREIPYGETRTYGEIARALGQPEAARAVGNACAANRTALVIPCHRVVRSDGKTGSYRWGAARKARLLQVEAQRSKE
jgi:AraC family transcriptional regulator, regulatory protein of adaptative response / methylated-DNA-[protein]-cysteine methyltransferase